MKIPAKMGRRKFCRTSSAFAIQFLNPYLFGYKKSVNHPNKPFKPSYLQLHRSGELSERGKKLWNRMEKCNLCPRSCGTNRLSGKAGFCGANADLIIASYAPHFGEERPLVGHGGSGTIFFSHCSLRCIFCINWDISQGGRGRIVSIDDLADMMLYLQKIGCHNINVVTPTHYAPHILLALDKAAANGLHLPLVYNTCGWEQMNVLEALNGIVDIYLPDYKYADSEMAVKYSSDAATYPEKTQAALKEMHRQAGVAKPNAQGIMERGLMIRHLVMPHHTENSKDVLTWIAAHLPRNTYINIMSQYRPVFKAEKYPEINRTLTRNEYEQVIRHATDLALSNIDIQGL
ncbi:radical SAM protein [bacterium]|nr:radical SAM protein [bacterium]